MTAQLIECDTFTQVAIQAAPLFKGRSLLSWGNGMSTHGIVEHGNGGKPDATFAGGQHNGWCDDGAANQFANSMGWSYQYPFFENSGSAADDEAFTTVLESVNGILVQRQFVNAFGCGSVDLHKLGFNPSVNLNANLLLSGKTLSSMAGYLSDQAGGGNVSVTGLGFRPKLMLFSFSGWPQFDVPVSFIGEQAYWAYGAADGTNQWSVSASSGGWLTGGDRHVKMKDGVVICNPAFAGGVVDVTLVSFDADGFTVNYGGAFPSYVTWIALDDVDGEFAVGIGTEGDSSITPGFQAEAAIFANCGQTTTSGASIAAATMGVGGSDDALRQAAGFAAGEGFRQNAKYWQNSAIAIHKAATGFPWDLSAEAYATSFGPTTVGLNWTTGGSGGVKFGWVAVKTSPGPGFDGCGGPIGQIYRWLKR
jgi:hypothetical protein